MPLMRTVWNRIAIVLALPALAFAWASDGHKIIAEIAPQRLTPQA
jgi:hypothetical protein